MGNELWLRFQPRSAARYMPKNGGLSVLIPIHVGHYIAFGKEKQSELSGKGEVDSKVVLEYAGEAQWEYSSAVEHSSRVFSDLKHRIEEGTESTDRIVTIGIIERLPCALMGRQIIAPSGMAAQEIVLPSEDYRKMISEASSEPVAFLVAHEIARICLENRHLEVQPNDFQLWAVSAFLERVSRPGKRPEGWGKYPRNHAVVTLAKQLVAKGLTLTRNEASEPTSAFDAIAEGARHARVKGLSSYETVKGVFYKATR